MTSSTTPRFEMLLANHVKGFGTLLGQLPESSQRQFLVQYLGNGYPLGTQALLGTFSGLIDTSVAVIYQPYISSLAALGAMALASIGERRLGGWRAALVGGRRDLAPTSPTSTRCRAASRRSACSRRSVPAVALAYAAIGLERPYAGAACSSRSPAAAALATYNAVALPYVGALVLFLGLGVAAHPAQLAASSLGPAGARRRVLWRRCSRSRR